MERSGNGHHFTLSGARLTALPSGALWWADEGVLTVSDLHLGKAERMARRGGALLPPYEVTDTLMRLESLLDSLSPATVICLGDTFDDTAAATALPLDAQDWLARLQAGRRWIWIEGNHDPGPVALGGAHMAETTLGPLTFRHIAEPAGKAEISGHYHPKARFRGLSRPCVLTDGNRAILPAFGTYTGGLSCTHPALASIMGPRACALLCGAAVHALPVAALA